MENNDLALEPMFVPVFHIVPSSLVTSLSYDFPI